MSNLTINLFTVWLFSIFAGIGLKMGMDITTSWGSFIDDTAKSYFENRRKRAESKLNTQDKE